MAKLSLQSVSDDRAAAQHFVDGCGAHMLVMVSPRVRRSLARRAQAGVSMIVALIVLVMMTLGALSLMRSMDTSNLIAGNMAFQQSATDSSDAGVEAAIGWLEANNTALGLNASIASVGYTAATRAILPTEVGQTFWDSYTAAGVCFLPMVGTACGTAPGTPDAAGNTIGFMIQRLCNSAGPSNASGCALSPSSSIVAPGSGENQETGGDVPTVIVTSVYYRITVRVNGPRNTVSFVQAVVSM